jgi:hypothetical protein
MPPAPADTMEPAPIVTPGPMIAPAAIQQPSMISIRWPSIGPPHFAAGPIACVAVMNCTLNPILTLFPTLMRANESKYAPGPTITPFPIITRRGLA